MSEKRSLKDVFAEARAEVAAWPESMKELSRFRQDELRKIEDPPPPKSQTNER